MKYKIPKKLLNNNSPNDKIYSIRLNKQSQEILEKLAQNNKISKAEVIRIALKNLAT